MAARMDDDFELIANAAITSLGVKAHRLEKVISSMRPSAARSDLISILNDMKVKESTYRRRMAALVSEK